MRDGARLLRGDACKRAGERNAGVGSAFISNRDPSRASMSTPSSAARHTPIEDVHALLIGSSFIAVGLTLLKAAGLSTGGVAGIALIVSYATHWPVGVLFLLINIPFYVLAQRTMGWTFTGKTLVTNLLLAGLALGLPKWLRVSDVDPVFAAIFGGTIIGMGILALARHKSSVGGIGVLALWLYEKRGQRRQGADGLRLPDPGLRLHGDELGQAVAVDPVGRGAQRGDHRQPQAGALRGVLRLRSALGKCSLSSLVNLV